MKICRFIYELISPNGSYYQGDAFLKLIFAIVLKIDYITDELKAILSNAFWGIS
ncbi:MAG: hypothetical protein K0S22_959 [Oscillospiraceae bacterium]|nr:hypothetical protein [Oscillospiraceae bacterium]